MVSFLCGSVFAYHDVLVLISIQAFQHRFTSPTSVSDDDEDTENDPPAPVTKRRKAKAGKKATRGNLANILDMRGRVTPRSIAYVACLVRSLSFRPAKPIDILQVHFSLTDKDYWSSSDMEFHGLNYRAFYNFIVDYFEVEQEGTPERAASDATLNWWNKCVVFTPSILLLIAVSSSRQVFPHGAAASYDLPSNVSSLNLLKAQRKKAASDALQSRQAAGRM